MTDSTHDLSPEGEVDQLKPWLGLASFTEETRSFFYGREEEVGELARRIQRKLLTILFGQSGLGKTSILRAGLVPRLRGQGYCPVYVRIDYGSDAPSAHEQIRQALLQETAASGTWSRKGDAPKDESLWEFMHHRDNVLIDPHGNPLIPLLIFDQFEEIFTLAQSDDDGRQRANNFLSSLAELAENRPSKELEARLEEADDSAIESFDFNRSDYRVLITLREDYLAHLESLKTWMPSITQNRLRLAPMTGTQALAAVTGPGGKLVTPEVAEAIVRFVAGGAELGNAQVEPSLLSLICRELNDKRIIDKRQEISLDLLAGSHASILSDFYERALADQPQAVRNVIEDILLTDSGYRDNVAEERVLRCISAADPTQDAAKVLAFLVDRRLLRIEERLDVRRVELTHDLLCNVVQASRALRLQREERATAERELAAQREREYAVRKALVRARQIIAGCVVLTVTAVGSTIFGYINMKQAQEARALADSSRDGAEKVVGYLLDEFYTELKPVGRLDLIDELINRTVDYYQNLPSAMRSDATEANRGRALLRRGQVKSGEGKLAEAAKALDQAIGLLETTIANGNVNEADQLSLANAVLVRGLVAYNNGERAKAKAMYQRAVAITTTFATAPNAKLAARLVYAKARTNVGFIKYRDEFDFVGAQVDLNAARAVVSNEAERNSNIPAMMVYLIAGQWLHETLAKGEIKDYAAAEALAQELLGDVQKVLEKRPDHKGALEIREGVNIMRGYYALQQRLPGQALRIFDDGIASGRDMMRSDPDNQNNIDYLAVKYGYRAQALAQLGRPAEARIATDNIWALYERVPPSNFQADDTYQFAYDTAVIDAELGQTRSMQEMQSRMKSYTRMRLDGTSGQLTEATALSVEVDELVLTERAGAANVSPAVLADVRLRCEQLLAHSKDKLTSNLISLTLVNVLQMQAQTAYTGGEYEQAEASSRQALALDLKVDSADPHGAIYRTEHALALARLKRLPEASALIKLALTEQRARIANGSDDQLLRLELAQSLFVSALTQAAAGGAELNEAKALIAKLPAAIQNYRSVNLWRTRINEEIRLNTRSALVKL